MDTINFVFDATLNPEILITSAEFPDLELLPTAFDVVINGNGAVIKKGPNVLGRFIETNNSRISNLSFEGANSRVTGGGIFISDNNATPGKDSVFIENCFFTNNIAGNLEFAGMGSGGAIRVNENGYAKVTNCTFTGNRAKFGAAFRVYSDAVLDLVSCTIYGNLVDGDGTSDPAAIWIFSGGTVNLEGTVIWDTYQLPDSTAAPDLHDEPLIVGPSNSGIANRNSAGVGLHLFPIKGLQLGSRTVDPEDDKQGKVKSRIGTLVNNIIGICTGACPSPSTGTYVVVDPMLAPLVRQPGVIPAFTPMAGSPLLSTPGLGSTSVTPAAIAPQASTNTGSADAQELPALRPLTIFLFSILVIGFGVLMMGRFKF